MIRFLLKSTRLFYHNTISRLLWDCLVDGLRLVPVDRFILSPVFTAGAQSCVSS